MAARSHSQELALIDIAEKMLAETTSIEEVKSIRDKAESFRVYARTAQLGLELQNRAAELKLKAERRAGNFIASLRLHGGDRRSSKRESSVKLEDVGINKSQSRRWQLMALVPDDEFNRYIKASTELGEEISTQGLLRIASVIKRRGKPKKSAFVPTRMDDKIGMEVLSEGVVEALAELHAHQKVMTSILEPVCEGVRQSLTDGARRHLKRLLIEMESLIWHLEQACAKSEVSIFTVVGSNGHSGTDLTSRHRPNVSTGTGTSIG